MYIEIEKMSEEQLDLLAQIDPNAVKMERSRRSAYESMEEAFNELNQALFNVETLLQNTRKSKLTEALKQTGLVETVQRVLASAWEHEGILAKTPKLPNAKEK